MRTVKMQDGNVQGHQQVEATGEEATAIELTSEERLRLENYHLKRSMLEMEIAMKQAALARELVAMVATIKQRTGVDIRDDRYEVDIERGRCTAKQMK